jgi:GDPmannose 4,6-dehydratase
MSFVPLSWQQPLLACQITGISALRILEAIRSTNPCIRYFQAGSSEMFGRVTGSPQNETTPFRPRNPYGVSKVFAHHITANYRDQYGIFACTGILYNHESPRRSEQFVTRKITRAAAAIKLRLLDQLVLGNLDAYRDWGFAGDYVKSMCLMLQQDEPGDFVIGTGRSTSVREFARLAFRHVDLDFEDFVSSETGHCRPPDGVPLVADPTRATQELKWTPTTTVQQLVAMMVEHDLHELTMRQDSENPSGRVAA